MLFHSSIFFLFFALVFFLYWLCPHSFRKYILLAASFVFYGYWSRLFLLHFFLVVCTNYLFYWIFAWRVSVRSRLTSESRTPHSEKNASGIFIPPKVFARADESGNKEKLQEGIYPKAALLAILVLNLGNLVLFKYFYFLADAFGSVLSLDFFRSLGWGSIFGQGLSFLPPIILPLAISFYTFQILAFQIDVYRGKIKETVPFLHFVLFIMFFPQLIAGPIMRHSEFLPKIERQKRPHRRYLETALLWIFLGLVKKTLIADRLADWADPVFTRPDHFSASSQLWAVYGFSIQIYCDFSGYTDIARGVALALGFRIPANFSGPYLSQSFREFWRRWHITLSSWLRDYLYIPLGGNRHGKGRMYMALLVTMLLGGFWHGAHWNFLIWGFLHGLFLIAERLGQGLWKKSSTLFSFAGDKMGSALFFAPVALTGKMVAVKKLVKIVVIFHLTSLAWIFFRSPTFSGALTMLRSILWELPGNWLIGLMLPDTKALAVANSRSVQSLPFGPEHGLLLLAFLGLHVLEYKFSRRAVRATSQSLTAVSEAGKQRHRTKDWLWRQWRFFSANALVWPLLGFLAVFAILLSYPGNSFIYFQF